MAIRRGAKNGGDKRASAISRLMRAAKLQTAWGADNPRYTSEWLSDYRANGLQGYD